MRRTLKIVVSCIATVTLTVGLLVYAMQVTQRKNSIQKYKDFFEQEEDFDVLFLGTSHVINGIYPMELWEDYGIVSYNLGGYANVLATSYWLMENALDYTTPKLMVIDCYGLGAENKVSDDIEMAHISMDAFPLTQTKITAVQDLFENKEDQMAFLFDFSVYHNRWSELEQKDFATVFSTEKGADSRYNVAVPNETICIDPEQKEEVDSTSTQYLRKAIEDCKRRGIDVLLTYLPFPGITEGQQKNANWISDLAEEYDVNYLDYYTFYDLVDFDTDCYDSNSHLNASGARKVTDYIGKYIIEHYDIEDQRENAAYSSWYEDYEEYSNMKLESMKEQTALITELMMMQDDHFSYAVCVDTSVKYFNNHVFRKLLENMGIDLQTLPEGEQIFIMVDHLTDTVSVQSVGEMLTNAFGVFRLECVQDGVLLSIDGGEKVLKLTNADLGLLVFDHETKAVEVSATASDYVIKCQ